jgi:hypothetical protein
MLGSLISCRWMTEHKVEPSAEDLVGVLAGRCEAASDIAACAQVGSLLLPKDEPRALRHLTAACVGGDVPSCQAVLGKRPTPEQRTPLLVALCKAGKVDSCEELMPLLVSAKPVDHPALFHALSVVCDARKKGQACEDLVAEAVLVTSADFRREKVANCDAQHLSWCRAGLATLRSGESSREFDLVLCEARDLAACDRLASQRDDDPVGAAWAQAVSCREGNTKACSALDALARSAFLVPDARTDDGFERAVEEMRLWATVVSFGPLPLKEVPSYACTIEPDCFIKKNTARVEEWFASQPRADTLKFVRERNLCQAFGYFGVGGLELKMPTDLGDDVEVIVDGSWLPSLQEIQDGTITAGVCARTWAVRVRGTEGTVANGELQPLKNFKEFETIRYAPPPTYAPDGWVAIGAEVLAGLPEGGESFITDTGTLLFRLELATNYPVAFGLRGGFSVPLGRRNLFGLQLGLGGQFGLLYTSHVKWRVLTAMIDFWATFVPLQLALVPSVGTQIGFALGKQELSLEVGLRLLLPVQWETARPNPLEPTPYLALLYRPSF